jgi:hypothetical protein
MQRWHAAAAPFRHATAFAPPNTNSWTLDVTDVPAVGDFLLLGDDPGGRWHGLTRGSFLVRDVALTGTDKQPLDWRDEWCLITVMNSESGRRLLLDGNKRALALWASLRRGGSLPTHVRLITGELSQGVIFVGKALSPLWR